MAKIKAVKPFKRVSLVKLLHELAPIAKPNYISHYIFQEGDGIIQKHFNDVCYARFLSNRHDKNYNKINTGIIKARVYLNQYSKHFKSKEEVFLYKKYIDWVVNSSPWKDAFLNGKSNYFKNGLSINCNQVHQYVAGAMTAIREPLEHHHQPKVFDTLVKKGISPELSHMISGICCGEFSIGKRGGGHDVFSARITTESVKDFKGMNHIYKDKKPLKEDSGSFYGIQDLFPLKGIRLETIISGYGEAVCEGWYKRNVIDWNNPELLNKLKEIDNA